jgi:hypothetical protein
VPLDAAASAQALASVATLKKEAAGTGACAAVSPLVEEPTPVDSVPTEVDSEVAAIPTADPEELASGKTVDQPLPLSRLGLAAALALGIPTMIAGPFLTRRGRQLASLEEIA